MALLTQLLLLASLCLLALTRAGGSSSQDAAVQAEAAAESGLTEGRMGRLAYLLSKRSARLLAPPLAHAARFAPFLQRRQQQQRRAGRQVGKRDDGYWIWMPANGYMAVPKDEGSNVNDNRESTSLMRYG